MRLESGAGAAPAVSSAGGSAHGQSVVRSVAWWRGGSQLQVCEKAGRYRERRCNSMCASPGGRAAHPSGSRAQRAQVAKCSRRRAGTGGGGGVAKEWGLGGAAARICFDGWLAAITRPGRKRMRRTPPGERLKRTGECEEGVKKR